MSPDDIPDEVIVALDDARNAGLVRWHDGHVQARPELEPELRRFLDEHAEVAVRLLRPLMDPTTALRLAFTGSTAHVRPTAHDLLEVDDPVAFVAVLELADSLGTRFHVDEHRALTVAGPTLPQWCGPVLQRWAPIVISAYLGHISGHRLYCCTACCFPMALVPERKGRRCPSCGAARAMTHRLPVHFVNPPMRRRIPKEAS